MGVCGAHIGPWKVRKLDQSTEGDLTINTPISCEDEGCTDHVCVMLGIIGSLLTFYYCRGAGCSCKYQSNER